MTLGAALLIGIHALIAWIAIEIFVNLAHGLRRWTFIVTHYLVVVAAFAVVFYSYDRFFGGDASPFAVTATAMGSVLLFEFIVFRFLYSGERWFLNWVDWMVPLFLATTTVYAAIALW